MGIRRSLVECILQGVHFAVGGRHKDSPASPKYIFVLRNNDIGDLIVVTPLFEALKRRFPDARVIAGIGDWNREVLRYNPWVNEVVAVNGPWHNKQRCRYPNNSWRGLLQSLAYILFSKEARVLADRHCDVGIDVLGSPEGALLMLRAGIPFRLGVKGYAGGHSATHRSVTYNPEEHVSRSALRFAEFLGANTLPECRPQLFLARGEEEAAEGMWQTIPGARRNGECQSTRIVIGPGGGFPEKCWPLERFLALAQRLAQVRGSKIIVVGGREDTNAGREFSALGVKGIADRTGQTSMRETFALVAAADLVICNASMLMHAAAAFRRPTVVLLGDYFDSAEQHARQWGYSGCWANLGKDAGRRMIWSVDEVQTFLEKSGIARMTNRSHAPEFLSNPGICSP